MIEFLAFLILMFFAAQELMKRQRQNELTSSLELAINQKLSERLVYSDPLYKVLLNKFTGDPDGADLFKKIYALHCLIKDKESFFSIFSKKIPESIDELVENLERLTEDILTFDAINLPNRVSAIDSILLSLMTVDHGAVKLCISNLKNTINNTRNCKGLNMVAEAHSPVPSIAFAGRGQLSSAEINRNERSIYQPTKKP